MSESEKKEIAKLKRENAKFKKDKDYWFNRCDAHRAKSVEQRDLIISLRTDMHYQRNVIEKLTNFDSNGTREHYKQIAYSEQDKWMADNE